MNTWTRGPGGLPRRRCQGTITEVLQDTSVHRQFLSLNGLQPKSDGFHPPKSDGLQPKTKLFCPLFSIVPSFAWVLDLYVGHQELCVSPGKSGTSTRNCYCTSLCWARRIRQRLRELVEALHPWFVRRKKTSSGSGSRRRP